MRILQAILFGLAVALLLVLTLVASGSWSPARGQTATEVPPCGALEQMLTALARDYGEEIVFEAIANDGTRLIVTANPAGSTWTAMTVDAAAMACMRRVGQSWRSGVLALPQAPKGIEG